LALRVVSNLKFVAGVTVSVSRSDTPGAPLTLLNGTRGKQEPSTVDVGAEMVDLLTTKRAYSADLKAVGTENETLGTLLDIADG
jgi:flagellar hook protein FlgE